MLLMFFRGLVLTTALDTLRLGARRTALMASDLSRAERSVLAILGCGRFQPALVAEGFFQVPYSASGAGVRSGVAITRRLLTKLLEGRLGPDYEPAHVTAGGELQQVQVVHLVQRVKQTNWSVAKVAMKPRTKSENFYLQASRR